MGGGPSAGYTSRMQWSRVIAHVDLDAFFASVEQLDHPELRGQPVLVGGRGKRAVVAAASYEARRFGCHSAQPMSQALRHCPQALVCPPRFERYSELSADFFSVLGTFSPLVESLSIDEGFVDLSGSTRLLGKPAQLPPKIMRAVLDKTGLSASVGLAPNKFLAKMASEVNKPRGFHIIEPGQERSFLKDLKVSRLWGVGKKTEAQLHRLGLFKIGDIAEQKEQDLTRALGSLGLHLHRLSRGKDLRKVEPRTERKQIGIERTFDQNIRGIDAVQSRLLSYAEELADRLVRKDLRAQKVQIKLRRPDFETITRQQTLPLATYDAQTLYRAGLALFFRSGWTHEPLRLLGLSVGQLYDQSSAPVVQTQLSLLEESAPEQSGKDLLAAEARQRLVSKIRDRFGEQSLSLGKGSTVPDDD